MDKHRSVMFPGVVDHSPYNKKIICKTRVLFDLLT
jgi:hypothetical protein